MRRALLARMRALLVVALLAAPSYAGTYIGAAVGPSTESSGDGTYNSNARTYKGLLGYSIGQISIEGMVSRGGVTQDGGRNYDVTQAAVAGKYSLPISDGFEAFGRIGYGRTWLGSDDDQANSNGDGWLIGAGIEYRLKLVATQASIFVDYNVMTSSQNGPSSTNQSFDTRGFSIGATIGF